jgi:hypothetical protein
MADVTKAKINLRKGEFEFEGNQAFVEKQLSSLSDLIDSLHARDYWEEAHIEEETEETTKDKTETTTDKGLSVPDSFGEWYNKFPKKLTQSDQILIAGYFVQSHSTDRSFKTSKANKFLKEQGIKLSNPSVTLKKQVLKKKWVFVVKKKGVLHCYRVSAEGKDHLRSLLKQKKAK